METKERERIHLVLEKGLATRLEPLGFVRAPDLVSRGQVFRRWERRVGWRLDGFEMVTEEGYPDESGPALQVNIHVPLPDGSSVTVTGGSVGGLFLGRAFLFEYGAMDGLRTALAQDRVLEDALGVCERAIAWLDEAGTPANALVKLGRGNPNKFKPGHPIFVAMEIVKNAMESARVL